MYKALGLEDLGIDMPLLEGIELAARHGFTGLRMNPEKILEAGIDNVVAAMDKYGIINAGFNLPDSFKGDEETYKEGLEKLPRLLEAVRKTGGTRASTYILSFSETLPYDEEYDNIVRRLRPYAFLLKEYGIFLGLEFLGSKKIYEGKKYPFIHTLPEILRLADSIGTGNCGVLLDSYHCHTAGYNMDIVKSLYAYQIGLVHVNDAMEGYAHDELPDSPRMLPGETGVIDIPKFLRNLKHIGYEGPVVVEPFYEKFRTMKDPDEKVRMVKEALDSVWPN